MFGVRCSTFRSCSRSSPVLRPGSTRVSRVGEGVSPSRTSRVQSYLDREGDFQVAPFHCPRFATAASPLPRAFRKWAKKCSQLNTSFRIYLVRRQRNFEVTMVQTHG